MLFVYRKYLEVIRKLQMVYLLEPAGSHGVWGLDDYTFINFLWGSSQLYSNTIISPPSVVRKSEVLTEYGDEYLYVDAIRAIKHFKSVSTHHQPKADSPSMDGTVRSKRAQTLSPFLLPCPLPILALYEQGPFFEHSPMLWDISEVREGWPKINSGLIKMYRAEVWGKVPVVQHLLFGSIFQWGE